MLQIMMEVEKNIYIEIKKNEIKPKNLSIIQTNAS